MMPLPRLLQKLRKLVLLRDAILKLYLVKPADLEELKRIFHKIQRGLLLYFIKWLGGSIVSTVSARRAERWNEKYLVKPADPKELKRIFLKYSTVTQEGVKYMTHENLIRDYLGMLEVDEYNKTTLSLLAGVVDQTKDGLISFEKFEAFERLLRDPDSYHKLIFHLFDLGGNGSVSFDEFETVIKKTDLYDKVFFKFNTDFISSYFGPDKARRVSFFEFVQLFQDFEKEYLCQAFFSEMVNGEIPVIKFEETMKSLRGHLLNPYVRNKLLTVAGGEARHQVSYGYYRAFNDMLDNILVLHEVSNEVSNKVSKEKEIQKEEFLHAFLKSNPEITPLQVDILYNLCDVDKESRITVSDVHHILPKFDVFKVFLTKKYKNLHWFCYVFFIFSIATGAAAGYPTDLVKTRMQNQRAVLEKEKLYRNIIDCAKKVLRNEGPRGMYRGLLLQLVGVLPEKAIKLWTNEMVRRLLSDNDGFISLPYEIVAGACSGAAQVSITNPLEIVKIRLQVAGEQPHTHGKRVTFSSSIKELGFTGLYKGARACFLRDIPFSGIFFPVYAHLKSYFADKNGHNGTSSLFGSAMLAGAPAAFLVTPADVIKTRLQVKPRHGQQSYQGVFDAFSKIIKEEGVWAFWKGGGARVLKLPPQFGIIMMSYELLQGFFKTDFGGSTTNPDLSLNPDHIGGMRVAVATYAGIETKFGLCLPNFRKPQKVTLNPNPPPTKTD